MALCIAAGGVVTALALQSFTLGWMHSIEKVRWEEDYRVEGQFLRLVEARVLGSGAGMEPPAGSRFEHGVWHYTPALPLLDKLRLTHSDYTTGYELCSAGQCKPLIDYAPAAELGGVIEVKVCAPEMRLHLSAGRRG